MPQGALLATQDGDQDGGGALRGERIRGTHKGARFLTADVTDIAAHAVETHGLKGFAAELCTEGITAAALLSAYLDEGERLTLQIQGSTPRFALTVDVREDGGIRARLTPDRLNAPPRLEGVMLVLKSVVGREVYRGATQLSHPNIAAMLQQHLQDSAQVRARVRIEGGRGAFAELLPDDVATELDEVLDAALRGLEGERNELSWSCSCSRQRVLDMLQTLGEQTLREMIEEDHGARVSCHFCNSLVVLDEDELRALL